MIKALVDELIPGADGWPSASDAGVHGIVGLRIFAEWNDERITALADMLGWQSGRLSSTDAETRIAAVKSFETANPELFDKIYTAARRLGWGETTTYGALAKQFGADWEIARDVGQAMAKNPIPLIIPCHRVLAAGGKIGGFSAPGGAATKAKMLEMEGVRLGEPAQPSLGF